MNKITAGKFFSFIAAAVALIAAVAASSACFFLICSAGKPKSVKGE